MDGDEWDALCLAQKNIEAARGVAANIIPGVKLILSGTWDLNRAAPIAQAVEHGQADPAGKWLNAAAVA